MIISLKHTYVIELSIKEKDLFEESNFGDETLGDFSLTYFVDFKESEKNKFCVIFALSILSEEYDLDTSYGAIFETDEEITDSFIASHFPSINAPAIAYPFLRSYISTISVNSGFKPIILSSINFTTFNGFTIIKDGEKFELKESK